MSRNIDAIIDYKVNLKQYLVKGFDCVYLLRYANNWIDSEF